MGKLSALLQKLADAFAADGEGVLVGNDVDPAEIMQNFRQLFQCSARNFRFFKRRTVDAAFTGAGEFDHDRCSFDG